jgi:hypothetical protein
MRKTRYFDDSTKETEMKRIVNAKSGRNLSFLLFALVWLLSPTSYSAAASSMFCEELSWQDRCTFAEYECLIETTGYPTQQECEQNLQASCDSACLHQEYSFLDELDWAYNAQCNAMCYCGPPLEWCTN